MQGTTYDFIEKNSEIPLILAEAEKHKYVALDTENSGGLDIFNPDVKLLLLQLGFGNRAFVIDARKVDLALVRDIIENTRWIKIAQYVNYDYKILKVLRGIVVRNIYDTKIAESLLTAGISNGKGSLEDLSRKYLELNLNKDTVMTFPNHPYDAPFTDEQIHYAAYDVLVLPEIRRRQYMYLKQMGLLSIADLEFTLAPVVAEMELRGIVLDAERWSKSLDSTKKKLFKISADLHQTLPDPPPPPPKPIRLKKDGTPYANSAKPKPAPILNLDSWQQLADACKQIGINLEEANKKTKKGLTNADTLKYAQQIHSSEPEKVKVLKNIIKYRGLNQVKKTFGDNLIEHIRSDGRIHARFHQNGTVAGRFSSSDPNLENIQKKGDEGRILRSCFIPPVGWKYIIADYSQLHLRIAAEISRDPAMLKAFSDPRGDIHKNTASQMFGVPLEAVTYEMRKAAKTINFGIIYGMGNKTLSERLGCSLGEAEELMGKYKQTYATLMSWLEEEAEKALNRGWSKTMKGRYRWFPPLNEKDENYKRMKSFLERVGKNHPILGTDADMLKTAMVLLHNPLIMIDSHIVNCVHDELVVEAPLDNAIQAAKLVKHKMVVAGEKFLSDVPVLVDVKIRDNWWKDDGVEDDENGQQLWLMPDDYGLEENGNGD